MAKLLIKYPTRQRWTTHFPITIKSYVENLSGEIDYKILITADEDEEIPFEIFQLLHQLNQKTSNRIQIKIGESFNKNHASNRDLEKEEDFDIGFLIGDDLRPVVKNFDKIIFQQMEKHFPNYDGILWLKTDDHERVCTTPLFGKKFMEAAGTNIQKVFCNPVYASFYADDEFTSIAFAEKSLARYFDEKIVHHFHPTNNKQSVYRPFESDALYERCAPDMNKDVHPFLFRQRHGFFSGYKNHKNDPLVKSIQNKSPKWAVAIHRKKENSSFNDFFNWVLNLKQKIKNQNLEDKIVLIYFPDKENQSLPNEIQQKRDLINYAHHTLQATHISFLEEKSKVHEDYFSLLWPAVEQKYDCTDFTWINSRGEKIYSSVIYADFFKSKKGIFLEPPGPYNVLRADYCALFNYDLHFFDPEEADRQFTKKLVWTYYLRNQYCVPFSEPLYSPVQT